MFVPHSLADNKKKFGKSSSRLAGGAIASPQEEAAELQHAIANRIREYLLDQNTDLLKYCAETPLPRGLSYDRFQRILRGAVRSVPFKFNVTIKGPFRSLIATAKSMQDPRNVIRDVLPVPIDQIPGVVTEVRRRETSQDMQQTPNSPITVKIQPPSNSESRP